MLDSALTGLRTFILLAVLAAAVALAGAWGWKAMTAPFPQKVEVGPCVDAPVKKGSEVYPSQVVVTVLNASTRAGLATRAMTDLVDAGFVKGSTGNAPSGTKLKTVEVWTPDKNAPSATLVASWLGDAKIVETKSDIPGIVVVTGENFPKVTGGDKTVTAKADGTICSPPVE
jgi:hypothetical protein